MIYPHILEILQGSLLRLIQAIVLHIWKWPWFHHVSVLLQNMWTVSAFVDSLSKSKATPEWCSDAPKHKSWGIWHGYQQDTASPPLCEGQRSLINLLKQQAVSGGNYEETLGIVGNVTALTLYLWKQRNRHAENTLADAGAWHKARIIPNIRCLDFSDVQIPQWSETRSASGLGWWELGKSL